MSSDSSDAKSVEGLREKWDLRHGGKAVLSPPSTVLARHLQWLPQTGRALDLACGTGSSALVLAERGFSVTAWDLSSVAVERVREEADARGLALDAEVRDVIAEPPPPASFDLIHVSHFLDRGLCAHLIEALRPSGLLLYQTWGPDPGTHEGPRDPAFRLREGELLQLFRGLAVRVYVEPGGLGQVEGLKPGLAMLLAELVV